MIDIVEGVAGVIGAVVSFVARVIYAFSWLLDVILIYAGWRDKSEQTEKSLSPEAERALGEAAERHAARSRNAE